MDSPLIYVMLDIVYEYNSQNCMCIKLQVNSLKVNTACLKTMLCRPVLYHDHLGDTILSDHGIHGHGDIRH
jgi:hypothetical protein